MLFYCCFPFLIVTCSSDDNSNTLSISPVAKNFLNEVLDIMEANSINKTKIDWKDFRRKVFSAAGGAQDVVATYPGIAKALTMLEDNHSFFMKPDGSAIFVGTIQCEAQPFSTPVVPANIGYVKVNSFSGSQTEANALAADLQDKIKSQDSQDILGWIVDLRGNGGGNMWPMVAGIGPILGEGVAGYFMYPDGIEYAWSYLNGASMTNGNTITQVPNAYELINPSPKVAVLIDKGVASSGEVMAISFIGRPNTRTFGSATCGLSSSNSTFNLSNNHILYLTTSYLGDRNKVAYGIPVEPDQVSSPDTIIQDAVNWIGD
jgi:carboxyl-terminal processing protease